MILQVHDELVFDIPVDEKEVFEKMVREVMEGVLQYSELRTQN
jgi:DNA polymerase I-like protein with 3'-5' exonuclease and polymerase domains